jgi:hypothetical protein
VWPLALGNKHAAIYLFIYLFSQKQKTENQSESQSVTSWTLAHEKPHYTAALKNVGHFFPAAGSKVAFVKLQKNR